MKPSAPQPFARTARVIALVLASVIIVGFMVLIALSYSHADDAGTDHWSHLVKILETASPLAGLAVGWVFGKEVHRKEAESAKDRALHYEREARRGVALAAAVRTAAPSAGDERAVDSHWQKLVEDAEALLANPVAPQTADGSA